MSPTTKSLPPAGGAGRGLFGFSLNRRVALSLYFLIPLFLILFTLVPAYFIIQMISRSLLAEGFSEAAVGLMNPSGVLSRVAAILIASGLVALAAGLAIAHALVRPVRRLQEAIRGVAAGRYPGELRLDDTGEFDHLGREFNRMTSQIALQDRLQRTERLAALGTLASGVAHEVRNPLGAVKGLAQLISESAVNPDQKRYAEKIMGETDRLNSVVERLLDLVRPSGESVEKLNLNRLIHDAVELSGYERNEKQITILEDYDETIPELLLDREGILQAVLNILLNAAQAIPRVGTIRVRTRLKSKDPHPTPRRVTIEIANTDSKIPASDYKKIFDPFYTTKENGTGLGLAIAHQVATAHDGIIEVSSRKGETVFTIELPAS
ncbi:MAG TPA: ATP-binding protein [Nitrospiria bacterium]